MSFIKVTALEFEALALSQEKPVPVPVPESGGFLLNPLTFPSNWSSRIRVTTRWQTDATRPQGSNRTERWALASRPARVLETTIVGPDRETSHALQQAVFRHTEQYGSPVPLYPDAVAVSAYDSLVVQGDFRYRRFFEGGRVVVLPLDHASLKRSDVVFLATLTEVTPDSITIDAAPREITPADVVIPCVDTELLERPEDSVALTDAVMQLSLAWSEIEGQSALPGTWPAVTPDNADILSPFCEILDDKAIFPFEPNWREGVTVSPARDIESSRSGRSAVQHGDGRPYHRIEISVMGHDRRAVWNVLRFFDSMQGRCGSFYLIHPLAPWQPFGSVTPAIDHCRIVPIGDPEAIPQYFRQVVLTRADGTRVSRIVDTVTDNGDHYALSFTVDLPSTDFVSVQPLLTCTFEEDALTEEWATSTIVPAMVLKIVEVPDAGAAALFVTTQIQFGPIFPAFKQYGGLNLLLHAGTGCYDSLDAPCSEWPANSDVYRWVDESDGPDRQHLPPLGVREMVWAGTGSVPSLVRVPQIFSNNRESMIMSPTFRLPFQLDSSLPSGARRLWGSTGWTLFMVTSGFRTTAGGNQYLIKIERPGGTIAFGLYMVGGTTVLEFDYQQDGGPQTSWTAFSTIAQLANLNTSATIITVHVDASNNFRLWINGSQGLSSAHPITGGLIQTADYVESLWFGGLSKGTVLTSASLQSLYTVEGCANMLLSYNKPLDLPEIQAIHESLADLYGANLFTTFLY